MPQLKNLKCPNWIVPRYTPKKKIRKPDPTHMIIPPSGVKHEAYANMIEALPYERCNGNLRLVIEAETDGGCGCCGYPSICVTVTCDVCGRCYEVARDIENHVANIVAYTVDNSATMRKQLETGEGLKFK